MPQQSHALHTDAARFAGNPALHPGAAALREVADGDPVTVFLDDRVTHSRPSRAGPVEAGSPALAFQRLRIVLAKAQAEAGVNAAPRPMADPVTQYLSDALAAAERSSDQHSRVYADAVRLAIAIRLLGQPESPRPAEARGPQEAPARQVRALQKWRLKRVLDYIEQHLAGKITLNDLAAVAGLSRMHFASQFRAATGLRPHEYLLRQRIRRAEELLVRSSMPIVEVALTVGFQTQAHFTTVFKRFMGQTPYQWRHADHAEEIAA